LDNAPNQIDPHWPTPK